MKIAGRADVKRWAMKPPASPVRRHTWTEGPRWSRRRARAR